MKLKLCCAISMMTILAVQAFAEMASDPRVPVDRLIANTTAYIKEYPQEAMGPYTLARIHYLALATRSSLVLAYNGSSRQLPRVNDPVEFRPATNIELKEDQLRDHLHQAVENYRKAIKMEDKNALFHLGLASVSRAALNAGFKLGPIPGAEPPEVPKDGDFASLWREQSIKEYLRAYELSNGKNDTISFGHIADGEFTVLMSYEAGQRYVELVTARGVRPDEQSTVEKVRTSVEGLKKTANTGMRITPIVFRLSEAAPLDDLLDTQKTVAFDLDGTRRPQRYRWVRPDTGILVWDPLQEGKIVSGHQLFGSVSFQMFWSDGYRALDALDDNRDGQLRGNELLGLAVWFDRNQNGVSDPGEVISLERSGIEAISVRATARTGESLANETGLTMSDGRVLPTYDWTTRPLPEVPDTSHGLPKS